MVSNLYTATLLIGLTVGSLAAPYATCARRGFDVVVRDTAPPIQEKSPSPTTITAAEASAVLDQFESALNERWSYRYAKQSNFEAAIGALRKRISGGISLDAFGIELQKIIALGIDGHARVSGWRFPPGGYLPFLMEPLRGRVVAFAVDRQRFLADGFPFITRIDGKSINQWSETAAVLVSKGSSQYVLNRSLRLLRYIDYWRLQLNLPRKPSVDVEVEDAKGKTRKVLRLELAKSAPTYGVWPSGTSRVLPGNVGYLRLSTMEKSPSIAEITQWMPAFRTTAGLVVDVRDNDGGDRDALRLLSSYLADPTAPPRVFTAAVYRLQDGRQEDYLADENHRMYRLGAKEWSPGERTAVAEFARTFRPRWKLPKNDFSDFHYMALTRVERSDIFHYNKPVMVLVNGKSFSATDIFLAGLKGMSNVLLMGTPSAGGSAYTQELPLGATGLTVRLGTIVSFQADGRLFDGNGIDPDVLLEPMPEYYIGGVDNVLDAAVKRINAGKH